MKLMKERKDINNENINTLVRKGMSIPSTNAQLHP